ncbi:hypothetical protein B1964_15835 [Gordonia sp. i37]|nr:hypothetical protein B1964_15835 [Gordonia sp. i37]
MMRTMIDDRGLEASSLALLGTSTIGKYMQASRTRHPFPPMIERFHRRRLPLPPMVEVRAACGEPRDPAR